MDHLRPSLSQVTRAWPLAISLGSDGMGAQCRQRRQLLPAVSCPSRPTMALRGEGGLLPPVDPDWCPGAPEARDPRK
eukprot:13112051-Alexandrium_andersonii.AAC.1